MIIAWLPCITGRPRGRSWPGLSEQLHPLHTNMLHNAQCTPIVHKLQHTKQLSILEPSLVRVKLFHANLFPIYSAYHEYLLHHVQCPTRHKMHYTHPQQVHSVQCSRRFLESKIWNVRVQIPTYSHLPVFQNEQCPSRVDNLQCIMHNIDNVQCICEKIRVLHHTRMQHKKEPTTNPVFFRPRSFTKSVNIGEN